MTNVTKSSRILTGLITDATDKGQWHGATMSHHTSGSVIWRVKTRKQGWDSHGDIPKTNLVDLYEAAKMPAHGGFYKNEPHHLKGLTLWNYKRVGDPIRNYNFWSLSGKGMYWGFSAVNPFIVGLHGSAITFDESNVGYLESLGKAVLPESLYEAQLKHRLGKMPKWVKKSKKAWHQLEKNYWATKDNPIVNGISRIGWMTGGRAALWDDETIARRLVKKSIDFITSNKNETFFLYLSTHDIHVPRVPNIMFQGKSGMGPRGDAICNWIGRSAR